jgi:TP901-1 family phage major tail protein
MSTAIQGKRIIYKYRVYEDATTEAAWTLAFKTEDETKIKADADATKTKDGTMRTPSDPEIEISSTSIMAKEDEKADKLKAALLGKKLIEMWEINLDKPVTTGTGQNTVTKYKGTYYQGYLTEFNVKANAEDMAEISTTFGANGIGADGNCTVTDEEISEASYVFADTTQAQA